jgi:hypothetical protein
MSFLHNLFGKKETISCNGEPTKNQKSEISEVPPKSLSKGGGSTVPSGKIIRNIREIEGEALARICVEIMVDLQLTYMEGVDEIPIPDIAKRLVNDKNISEKLAQDIANATFNAYKISGGNTNKYLTLCAESLKKL